MDIIFRQNSYRFFRFLLMDKNIRNGHYFEVKDIYTSFGKSEDHTRKMCKVLKDMEYIKSVDYKPVRYAFTPKGMQQAQLTFASLNLFARQKS